MADNIPRKSYKSQKVSLSISDALLKQIDQAAVRDFTTRSGIVRLALIEYVRNPANNFDLDEYLRDMMNPAGL